VSRMLRRRLGLGRAVGDAAARGFRLRPLEQTRLNRSGLAAGTPAPDFELPDLEGRTWSLGDFRRRRILLVFAAPDCVPCDELAPDLVSLHDRNSAALEVLMIVRGDLEENRAKVLAHGFTFPVLVQKGWQVSKRYARFATPVAYVIDERGDLATGMAAGLSAIRRLIAAEEQR
jgi:peroxiredoxin